MYRKIQFSGQTGTAIVNALKFDIVGKHSSSTKIITLNIYQCIKWGKCTASNSH